MVGPEGTVVGLDNVPALVDMSNECLKTWVQLDSAKLDGGYASVSYAVADVNKPLELGALGGTSLFDAIHVGVAVPNVPQSLLDVLNVGGRMILPIVKDTSM